MHLLFKRDHSVERHRPVGRDSKWVDLDRLDPWMRRHEIAEDADDSADRLAVHHRAAPETVEHASGLEIVEQFRGFDGRQRRRPRHHILDGLGHHAPDANEDHWAEDGVPDHADDEVDAWSRHFFDQHAPRTRRSHDRQRSLEIASVRHIQYHTTNVALVRHRGIEQLHGDRCRELIEGTASFVVRGADAATWGVDAEELQQRLRLVLVGSRQAEQLEYA